MAEIYPEIKICGVCPGPEEKNCDALFERVKRNNPRAEAYGDYETLLRELKPDILVVTAYCGFHAQIAMACIQRGVHIYTEKPAATSLAQLGLLEQSYYRQNQVKLSAMMLSRYHPGFQAGKAAIEEGKIGKLRLFSCQKSYQFGSRTGMYENPDFYGGTIPWVGSHAIDWIYWMSGLKFQEVYALQSRIGNQGVGELETTAVCSFKLEQEVLAVITIDLFRPEGVKKHGDDKLRIVGTEGTLEISKEQALLMDDRGVHVLDGTKEMSPFIEFVKDIQGLPSSAVSAKEVFEVTRACLQARESAATGERICWRN